jgi:hypothetical protein
MTENLYQGGDGSMSRVYVATETYSTMVDGIPQTIHKGKTRVREGHQLLADNPQYYELAGEHVHFDVEQATAAPGEKRGASEREKADEKADEKSSASHGQSRAHAKQGK